MKTAVLCIAAEFERPYLQEWADWHHNIGFDDIWIITNNWDLSKELYAPWIKTARIDGQVKQLQAYNDWLYSLRTQYDWALVVDVDEFLYLPTPLEEYLNANSSAYCLGIPWVQFGDGGPNTPTKGSVVKRFQRCEGRYNKHVKMLVNLKRLANARQVYFVNQHFVCADNAWVGWQDIFGAKNIGPYNNFEGKAIDRDLPFLAHYYTKTLEEWRKRRGPAHMRADCAQYVTEDWFAKENHNEVECTWLADTVQM